MPTDSRFVHVGEAAPVFSLPSVGGEPVSLDQFKGKSHVVLVFLRGFM